MLPLVQQFGISVNLMPIYLLLLADLSGSREFQLTLEIKTSSKFRPVRESCIQVEYVTSLLTAMRQFCGLMHFSKSLLVSDILKPRKAVYFCSEDYQQSSLVSKVLQRKLILSPSTTLDSVMIITAVILICFYYTKGHRPLMVALIAIT